MAIIELQMRVQKFQELLRNRINGQRLPVRSIEFFAFPELHEKPLQRIECVKCTLEPGSEKLNVATELILHYNSSYLPIREAGSLQPPATDQLRRTIQIQLSLERDPQTQQVVLKWAFMLNIFPGGVVPLDLSLPPDVPGDLRIQTFGLVASESVVAIRLGTNAADPVTAPIVDRLANSDWAQLISGQFFGDLLAVILRAAMEEAAKSDDVHKGQEASGAWFPAFGGGAPFAAASATLVLAKAVEVPVHVQITASLAPSGYSLVTTVRVSWNLDTNIVEDIVVAVFATPIGFVLIKNFVESEIGKKVLGHANAPDEFHEIARDDESITFQREGFIGTPPQFALTHSEVNNDGLLVRGTLGIQNNVRNLQGSVSPPASVLDSDCGTRSVRVRFEPAKVVLTDPGLEGGAPRLFPDGVIFLPPKAWQVKVEPSSSYRDLTLSFIDPPTGRLAPGTATSVFLHTDCGMRWADLGVIPQDHAAPTTGDIAAMISRCMAISDPWGEGIMNLDWLVDPPDVLVDPEPLRLWAFNARDLPESSRLEFVAVGPQGETRQLAVIAGQRQVVVQFATEANETLQVRTDRGFTAPAPAVQQRWVIPFARVALGKESVSVSVREGMIAIMDAQSEGQLVDMGTNGQVRVRRVDKQLRAHPAIGRVWSDLIRTRDKRTFAHWSAPIQVDARTVAVLHKQELVMGLAGPARRM